MIVVPPRSTLFPYTTLFRSHPELAGRLLETVQRGLVTVVSDPQLGLHEDLRPLQAGLPDALADLTLVDRKSTRLNSSHVAISYAVFCLKKKKNKTRVV